MGKGESGGLQGQEIAREISRMPGANPLSPVPTDSSEGARPSNGPCNSPRSQHAHAVPLMWLMGLSGCADETKAKLMAVGKKTLHFTCSNFPALVMLPLAAWTYVRLLSTPAFTQQ